MQKNNVKVMAVSAVVIVICLLASWQYTAVDEEGQSSGFADAFAGGDCSAAYDSLAPEVKEVYESLGGLSVFETEIRNSAAGIGRKNT